MKLTLFDIRRDLPAAWTVAFDGVPDVAAVVTDLAGLKAHDCLVSPANSLGIMDGGIDAAIAHELPEVQARVSAAVGERWLGEQPVGTSLLVETGSERFRWLAHTPTMRSPRPIARETAYDAMCAMLIAVRRHNAGGTGERINSVACPGLGTATGGVPADAAAQLMRLAYERVVLNEPHAYSSWGEAGPHLRAIARAVG